MFSLFGSKNQDTSQSATLNQEEVVNDTIKIKMTKGAHENLSQGDKKKLGDAAVFYKYMTVLNDPPTPRQEQPVRDDENYVDPITFAQFQKEEVQLAMNLTEKSDKFLEISQVFAKKRPDYVEFIAPKEEKKLIECFKDNPGRILKCSKEAIDFIEFANKAVNSTSK